MALTKFPVIATKPKVDVVLPVGTHTLELVVEDNLGLKSAPAVVVVTVKKEAAAVPTITDINPKSGVQGAKLEAAITGENLAGAKAVEFFRAGVRLSSEGVVAEVIEATARKVVVGIAIDAAATTGAYSFRVTTPAGTAQSPSGVTFTVEGEAAKLPVIEGIEPVGGKQGDKLEAVIYGANLEGAKEVVFLLAGRPDESVTGKVVEGGPEKLLVVIQIASTAVPGARGFTVTTSAGTAQSPRGVTFTVEGDVTDLPVIEGIEPVGGKQGDKLEAVIYGANLEGAKEVVFLLAGRLDESVAGKVLEGGPEKLLAVIQIASTAALGARGFAVTTSAGTAESPRGVTFTVEGETLVIPRLVNEVTGIGSVFTERLKEAGVTELGQMVALGPAGLAEVLGVSEERALGFIMEAKQLLGVPKVELTGRSVQEVAGIGSATAASLAESGITDLAELAAMEPVRLAEMLGISEDRAVGFVKGAQELL